MALDNLCLLVKKNLLTKKRDKKGTFIEVIFPVIFAVLLALISAVGDRTIASEVFLFPVRSFSVLSFLQSEAILFTPTDNPIVQCLNTRWSSSNNVYLFDTEDELDDYHDNYLSGNKTFASVIFSDDYDFTIRMDGDRIPATSSLISGYYELTNAQYYQSGFTSLQEAIYKTIIDHANDNGTCNINILDGTVFEPKYIEFPIPETSDDSTTTLLYSIGPLYLILGFLPSKIVPMVVQEKQQRVREGMKMMGLTGATINIAWYLTYCVIGSFAAIFTAIVASITLFPTASVFLVFFLCLMFVQTTYIYAFIVAAFFNDFKTATSVAGLSSLILMLPYYASGSSALANMFISISSPAAFSIALKTLIDCEVQGVSVGFFTNLVGTPDTAFPLYSSIIMLIFDTFFYAFLAWYLNLVIPGEYGFSLHWLFLCTPSYWRGLKHDENEKPLLMDAPFFDDRNDDERYETPSANLKSAIKIQNINKKFPGEDGKEVHAVNDVSLTLYEGQITALLGHNGAGKSTLIGMMTGLFQPTSGTASIYDDDLIDDIEHIQTMMGVCPQHDILFEKLTVREHLEFFGQLKGISKEDIKTTVEESLEELQMGDKIDDMAVDLSGGQKRKLSILISLMGRNKIIYLDECTSGMDPYSRRLVWNLLQRKKAGKVIIVVTHFMDEAELLGDRIAILNHGKVQCVGSSLFLKNRFGLGYHLDIVLKDIPSDKKDDDNFITNAVSDISTHIQNHIPQVKLITEASTSSYILPLDSISKFPDLFHSMDAKIDHLHISSYGVTLTSLEEVFLQLADEIDDSDNTDITDKGTISSLNIPMSTLTIDDDAYISEKIKTEKADFTMQLKAMMKKTTLILKRNKRALFFQFGFPLIYTFLYLFIASSIDAPTAIELPNLKFPIEQYSFSSIAYCANNDNFLNQVETLLSYDPSTTLTEYPVVDNVMEFAYTIQDSLTEKDYKEAYAGVYQYIEDNYYIFYNSTATHAIPNILQYMANSMISPKTTTMNILPYDYQLPSFLNSVSGFTGAFLIGIGFSSIPVVFGTSYVLEKQNYNVHVQRVMGVRATAYWLGRLIVDSSGVIIASVFLYILCIIFSQTFLLGDNTIAAIILLFEYAIACTLSAYVYAFYFENSLTAQGILIAVYSGLGMVLFLVTSILPVTVRAVYVYICSFFPPFLLMSGLYKLVVIDITRNANMTEISSMDVLYFDQMGGILFFGLLSIILYFILLLKFTSKKKCCSIQTIDDTAHDILIEEDIDVKKERERVEELDCDDSVKMINLRKKYQSSGEEPKVAVHDLSLGIQKGDFFGLLGPNGAGKTTTMKMMTGDIDITSGDVTLLGNSCKNNMDDNYSHFGFCPQFDGLFQLLTGREHLQMYAGVKGISDPVEIEELIMMYSSKLGLGPYLDQITDTYSGGTKRKLALAIALLGRPSIVLLDEPSTGMDPKARRGMWDLLSSSSERKDRVFILTTHVMEEAEELCNRIGIMTNGRLRCIGSPQHLRSRFGDGLRIELSTPDDKKVTNRVIEWVKSFGNEYITDDNEEIQLTEEFAGRMRFDVPKNMKIPLGELFGKFEAEKKEYSILDYAISQTTLDQVFVSLAREQETEEDQSKIKQ